ncbi:hypothetical protein [Brevundimonas sp.]|nr:hypothetical protein [Brevundimonas sp.]HYC66641.1 hypothetical protein [Brevundimonas sp.]
MSLWDLSQSWVGGKRANGVKDAPNAPSDEDFERAVALGRLDG